MLCFYCCDFIAVTLILILDKTPYHLLFIPPFQEAVWFAIPHCAHRSSHKDTVIKASVNDGPWQEMRTRDATIQDHSVSKEC